MAATKPHGARKGANRHHKIECAAGCGAILRMTTKAIGQMGGPPFCGCGAGRMLVVDLGIAARVLSDELLSDHPDYQAELAAEARRVIRDARSAGHRHQCGGCRKFIRSVREHCSCGYHNDIVGGRNEGRYVEGSARCAAWQRQPDMPF
jgi:hypothetical protein